MIILFFLCLSRWYFHCLFLVFWVKIFFNPIILKTINQEKKNKRVLIRFFGFLWFKSGIMLERKGVSYLLRIIITLYGSSCHDILITMQRSCNFEIVYFSRYSRKVFNFNILRERCTYMQIHMFRKFYNLLCLSMVWEIWEIVILIQLNILFSCVPY